MAQVTGATNPTVAGVFATWINKKFLSDLEFKLFLARFTAEATIPEGFGANTARFLDFAPPTKATAGYVAGATAIAEGSTTANEISGMTITPTNIVVSEYGEFLKVSQLYEYAAITGTRNRLQKRLSDGGALAIDTVIRNQAALTTNAFFADTSTAGGTTAASQINVLPAALGAAALITAQKIMYANLTTGIEGVPGHTSGNYAAILTPTQQAQVAQEVTTTRVTWSSATVQVPGRNAQSQIIKGALGDWWNISIYCTQNFATATYTGTSSADVGYMLAQDGLAATGFAQMDAQIIINDVNSPYKNVNSIAWHAYFGAGLVGGAGASVRVMKIYSLS